MIKSTNKRVIITITKQQDMFLTNGAKKLKISKSKFINYLINKNINNILNNFNNQDIETIKKIASVQWIKK